MATYIGIKGVQIPTVSSDPSNLTAGEVWYNTTTNTLKAYGAQGTGAWAAGGAVPVVLNLPGSAGTQTAALGFGGYSKPGVGFSIDTFSYNGSSWTELADMDEARYALGGLGTQTAALGFGGHFGGIPTNLDIGTEEWNGASWSDVADMDEKKENCVGAGITTAGLCMGGDTGPTANQLATVDIFNGTSWTETTELNTARRAFGGAGTTTAALAFGGMPPTNTLVESFDGTTWTETTEMNTGRGQLGGTGTQNAALAFAGYPASALTETWNGSTWTELADLSTGRNGVGGAGAGPTSALAFGGEPPMTGATEEWAIPDATKTVTSS